MKFNRMRTPTVLQMEAVECGAAALAIILAYYERYESLEKLRLECGVSRDGSKAVNILKVARKYGMKAQGAKLQDLDELCNLKSPCILFWEFNHFVVFEGCAADKFYINDPATGPRVVTRQEFDRSFTGVLLLFEPTADFKKGGAAPSLFNNIKQRLQGSEKDLAFIIIASLTLIIPGIIIPGFSKIFIDDILIQKMNNWIFPLLLGMLITALMRSILTWLQQKYLLHLEIKMMLINAVRFFWHVIQLPITFFQQRYAGDIEERVDANYRVAELLSGELSSSIVDLISMVFFALVMLLLDWQLTVIGIIFAILNGLLLYKLSRSMSDVGRRFLQEKGKLVGVEMSYLNGIETIKAMSKEDECFQRWAGFHAKTINSEQQLTVYEQFLMIIPQLLSSLLTVIILGLGSWQIIRGQITVGTLVAFQTLMVSFNAPLQTLLHFGKQLQQIRGDIARLDDVLKHPEDPRLSASYPKQVEKLQGAVELKDLTFGYSPLDPPFIENLSLKIKSNAQIAIVGQSGGGKSTLAKLICGLYSPWHGYIHIDDLPLNQISPLTLANSVSFVDQDIFLFEGTVRDNLTQWADYPEDVIVQAIKDACIEEDILERGGLNTKVIEGGVNFSGGQCARLEIARALINNPTLIILDEASASLDPIVEKRIYDNLKTRQMTIIIISHRLSTIRDSDEIIVLDQGKIVQRGKHHELIQQDGLYKQLIAWE